MTARRRDWSWDDPMTPPIYLLVALSVALGAALVGVAWLVSSL